MLSPGRRVKCGEAPDFKVNVGSVAIDAARLTIIAGPCLAESEELCLRIAEQMVSICSNLGFNYIFKASYDKANRTSTESARGSGIGEGLARLLRVKHAFGIPLTTDVHSSDQAAPAAE